MRWRPLPILHGRSSPPAPAAAMLEGMTVRKLAMELREGLADSWHTLRDRDARREFSHNMPIVLWLRRRIGRPRH